MGHGIAHAAAAAGFQTRLFDVSESQIERARSLIDGIFHQGCRVG
jgi:3-hydroxyacyl-CoA dehydrogenase